jgi:hypothetical protein
MPDIESIRQQIVTRLPVRVRWLVNGTRLDFDFSRSEAPLEPVMACDFNSATVIEKEWTSLRIFGEDDYVEGGGASAYLGVHSGSGEFFGLDVERETSEMFLLNSDVDRFIQTFLALDRVLRPDGLPDARIRERLGEIDPNAFERSEWRLLCDYVTQ